MHHGRLAFLVRGREEMPWLKIIASFLPHDAASSSLFVVWQNLQAPGQHRRGAKRSEEVEILEWYQPRDPGRSLKPLGMTLSATRCLRLNNQPPGECAFQGGRA
jgi:hypothetical protein